MRDDLVNYTITHEFRSLRAIQLSHSNTSLKKRQLAPLSIVRQSASIADMLGPFIKIRLSRPHNQVSQC